MNKTQGGGPAFPTYGPDSVHDRTIARGGMSLRDYFAAQALAAYLAGRNLDQRDTNKENTAAACYGYADAMIDERNKPEKSP